MDKSVSLFFITHKLRMAFTPLNIWEKIQKLKTIPWYCKIIWNSNFTVNEQFYWNSPVHIHFQIVYTCFYERSTERNICNRDLLPVKLNIFNIWPSIENVCLYQFRILPMFLAFSEKIRFCFYWFFSIKHLFSVLLIFAIIFILSFYETWV